MSDEIEDLGAGLDQEAEAVAEAASPVMDQAARALIGAASGGVLGVLLAGIAGLGRRFTGPGAMAAMVATVVACAAAMAVVNLRSTKGDAPPGPRSAWGVTLSATALLLTLVLFMAQSLYIQILTGEGQAVEAPLAIWPVSRVALMAAALLVAAGLLAALLGWIQGIRSPGVSRAGRWMAMAVLAAGAWAGVALMVVASGRGLVFGR